MKLNQLVLIFLFYFIGSNVVFAQEEKSLMLQLKADKIDRPVAIFKSSRLILGQSTVQLSERELQFRVSHLFGRISDGLDELYGLDQMYNVDISFEYGISNSMQVGLARSNDFDKTLQLSGKYAILKQSSLEKPKISLSFFGSMYVKTKDYEMERNFGDRLDYLSQIILARKFSNQFSAQIAPSYTYVSRVSESEHPHSIVAINLGTSMAITKSTNFNLEYVYTVPSFNSDLYDFKRNALSLGFDIETGGHVFQVFVTNSTRVQPGRFTQQFNNDNFFKGHLHIGFSIMRSFSL